MNGYLMRYWSHSQTSSFSFCHLYKHKIKLRSNTSKTHSRLINLVIKFFRTYGKFPATTLWPATCQATKSETSRRIFPRFPPPSLHSVFWLVHLINCLSCDWPEQFPLLHFTYDSLSLDNRNYLEYCFVKWLGDWSVWLILRHFAV